MPDLSVTRNSIPAGYAEFVARHEYALMFHSPEWLEVIAASAFGEMFILCVHDCGTLIGTMPLFISEDKGWGRVANSLPFFGSNGGVLAEPGRDETVFRLMADGLDSLAAEWNLRSYSIIQPVRDDNGKLYEEHFKPTFVEQRLCQIASLPSETDDLMDRPSPPAKETMSAGRGSLG